MAVPDYETLMLPVLRLTAEGISRVPEMIPRLAAEFGLSDEDLSMLLPSGRTPMLNSRAHWARTYMVKAGLVRRTRRGECEIADAGRAALRANPARIDNEVLAGFAEFRDWKAASATRKDPNHEGDPAPEQAAEQVTPEEQIDRAFAEIDSALADDLLSRIIECSPKFFEELIVDLLLAMGYGRGMTDRGRVVGRSGDGGIDGIVNEDALGLDAVYVQAKRYDPGTRVGRPAMQQFVGSLTGEGATKGVFVTTSDFSAEARDYVRRVQQRIVLINGTELARLMITHGVGVRGRRTYVLRSIDEDYFIEE